MREETEDRDGGVSPAVSRTAKQASSGDGDRRWLAVSAACAVAAVVLLLTAWVDAAFVAAVLGAVAWFWDQRNRIRAGVIEDGNPGGRGGAKDFADEDKHDPGAR